MTGAGALLDDEHPASQSETSERAARRLTVNVGLPALIYPPGIVSD
ncbi:peptidase [uncultured Pluralibacter sp.]|nr:peptidase [uncultured Pluralibacter sp.]